MLINQFFVSLKKHLESVEVPGKGKIFNKNVYICASFPTMQLSTIVSPLCLIVDYGSVPHKAHPRIQYQTFGVLSWVENNLDQYGESSVRDMQDLEQFLHEDMINLITLNAQKVCINAIKKSAITVTVHNTPCILRGWAYSILLEI